MSGSAEQLKARLSQWLQEAVAEDWIGADEIPVLESVEARGADQLFDTVGERPLTVGLFGGTGVGKSSLLNRFVGEPVAETGVERPTSTGVTVYAHEVYPLARLEAVFPVKRVRVLTHRRDEYREVVWIDMPDIDSVERSNRALVFEWLPCLDWLIYVVSPERYRDDAGWRVLKERGHRHHWLFVMNRADTGTASQVEDFRRLLAEDGFSDAVVLSTSCVEPEGDDFGLILEYIGRALSEQGLQRLQQRGEQARLRDLHRQCQRYTELLGGEAEWHEFIRHGGAVLDGKLSALMDYLRDEAEIAASALPDRTDSGAAPAPEPPPAPGLLADHVEDMVSGVAVSLGSLPAAPLMEGTRAVLDGLPETAVDALRSGFREGARRPGSGLQRSAAAFMRRLVYGLPLVVSLGIGYVTVDRYRSGLSGSGAFLGFDFLAHSLMILALSALAPYLLSRLLRPSVKRSIVRRVTGAFQQKRVAVLDQWREAMNELYRRSRDRLNGLDEIRDGIERALRQ